MPTSRSVFILVFVLLAGGLEVSAQSSPLQFVAIAPCRVVDTRNTGMPIQGGTSQDFAVQGTCGVPANAAAYSLNVTVVPRGGLNYLTVWPAGQTRPVVSLLNSVDGRVKANAAIVGAGSSGGGAVSVYATDTTDVVLDIDGYFTVSNSSSLAFYPVAPCRISDTRNGQFLQGGQEADFAVSGLCNIPMSAAGYSLNFTAIPRTGVLNYLSVWPTGQPQPTVSTLNSTTGEVVANAALVGAGSGGEVSVYPTDDTDLVIDINGYYAPPSSAPGGLSLYTLTPCRILDTRPNGQFSGTVAVNDQANSCGLPSLAQAVVVNATVLPLGPLGFLTLWPNGQSQPLASTLNAFDGAITSNMAVVPTSNGFTNAYASDPTQLLEDLSGYFALPSAMGGNYVFTFNGYKNGTPVVMAGSFVADGQGNITSGVLDYNDGSGEQPVNNPAPQTIGVGSVYSVDGSGLGTMTVVTNLSTYKFSVVINSDGSGKLIQSDPGNQQAFGSGVLKSQSPTAWTLCGSHIALGLFGFDSSLARYAGAGEFQFDPNTCVDAENGMMDIDDNGQASQALFTGAFNQYDQNTGRGVAGMTFQPGGRHFYAFYLISSADHKQNELVLVSTDPTSQPAALTLWSAPQQATPALGWDNSYLAGTTVAGLNAFDTNGAVDVTAGLFIGKGTAGNNCQGNQYDPATFTYDENQGGSLSQQQSSTGTYCVNKTTGRVNLLTFSGQFGKFPPVFYMVKGGRAFVVGTDPAVTSGSIEQQVDSPFNNGSIRGSYAGGTVAPITSAVTNAASWLFADGGGNMNGSGNSSGPGGPQQEKFNYAYTVDSTGRAVVQQSGSTVGIILVVSPQKFVMLPTTDPNPALSVFSAVGAD